MPIVLKEEDQDFLLHYGVLGMKWGVRKQRDGSYAKTGSSADNTTGYNPKNPGKTSSSSSKAKATNSNKEVHKSGKNWNIYKDGSIELDTGASIQRVVRGHGGLFGGAGEDLGKANAMYAAFTPKDKASYEHGFGRKKGLLVKEASQVLDFKVTKPLKSPPPKEAIETYYEVLNSNPQYKQKLQKSLGPMWNVDKISKDPKSNRAYELYSVGYDSANYNDDTKDINNSFTESLKSKGYNMLLDPSDSALDFDAPIVVFDAGETVDLSSRRIVTKESSKKIRQVYKEQTKIDNGKQLMEMLGYI